MASTTDSLESLQGQITSLAGYLQNQRALNLLTAEQGGTCILLGEKCCIYVNESELVKQDIQMLKDIWSSGGTSGHAILPTPLPLGTLTPW